MTAPAPWMPAVPPRGPGIRCTAELVVERSCLVCRHRDGDECELTCEPTPEIETCLEWRELAFCQEEETP